MHSLRLLKMFRISVEEWQTVGFIICKLQSATASGIQEMCYGCQKSI
jgi:hypothetical protein